MGYRNLMTGLLLVCSQYCFAQADTLSQIYNYTYKNIVAFNLYKEMAASKDVSKGYSYLPFYSYYLPDKGYALEMKIEKFDLNYPLTDFKLYEVTLDGFIFKNLNKNATKKSNVRSPTGSYLVAYNSKTKSIKFISGHFFYTPIHDDFDLNINKPASYSELIKLKLFILKLSEINYKKKQNKAWIFEAYSEKLGRVVNIKLPLNDVENPLIIN
jgi:hypothetical protein